MRIEQRFPAQLHGWQPHFAYFFPKDCKEETAWFFLVFCIDNGTSISKENPNFFLSSNLLHLTPYTSQITQS
jgi:hypothetical protein